MVGQLVDGIDLANGAEVHRLQTPFHWPSRRHAVFTAGAFDADLLPACR